MAAAAVVRQAVLNATSKHDLEQGKEQPLITKRQRRDSADSKFSDDGSAYNEDITETASTTETPLTPRSPAAKRFPSQTERKFKCPSPGCDKAFLRPTRLEEHVRTHVGYRPFRCSHHECDKAYFRQSHLDAHVKTAHSKIRDHVCDWIGCGQGFATAQRLKRHIERHIGEGKYICTGYEGCSERFRKRHTLQRHIDAEHLGKSLLFACTGTDKTTGQNCTKAYETLKQLREHELHIHTLPDHICTLCSAKAPDHAPVSFSTPTDLKTHLRTAHPPQCGTCSQIFKKNSSLIAHVESAHTKPYDRICPFTDCQRAFNKASNLQTHIRTVHEKERKFVCGETDLSASPNLLGWDISLGCGSSFGVKQALLNHVRRDHCGIRPKTRYVRKTDGVQVHPAKTVSSLSKLTGIGYDDHSGRDIACSRDGCTYRFYRGYDLEVHLDTFHGLEDFEIAKDLADLQAYNGGKFWLGDGIDDDDQAGEEDIDQDEMAMLASADGCVDPSLI